MNPTQPLVARRAAAERVRRSLRCGHVSVLICATLGVAIMRAEAVASAADRSRNALVVTENEDQIQISTSALEAAVRKRGYVSGVAGGSLIDRKTGFRDAGFGLDVVDWILEPGSDEAYRNRLPGDLAYLFDNLVHGKQPKRVIEGPQICTQARVVSPTVIRGNSFVAVRTQWRYTLAAPGKKTGSLWEQTLLFPQGKRYFLSSDRITAANASEAMFLRLDMPGHIRHNRGDTFSEVYLSYAGTIPASAFYTDFPPDVRFNYRRAEHNPPQRFIRAYHLRDPNTGKEGPWLAGMTLDPSVVYEAWCHQRGYVCMIEEFGGRPVQPGQTFHAVFLVGFFDSIAEMNRIYDRYAGNVRLEVNEKGWRLARGQAREPSTGASAREPSTGASGDPQGETPGATATAPPILPVVRARDSMDWANVGNDKGGMRYSPLKQINRESVKALQVAWTYHTGDADPASNTTIECTPLVVNGVLYLTTVRTKVVALDAATGQPLWKFDPFATRKFSGASGGVNRGVAYWTDGKPNGQRRILVGVADARLISLDARTGQPDPAFGNGGTVDLKVYDERDLTRLSYGPTSAPGVWNDKVILGFSCGEGPDPAAPGDVRAFDVHTGKEAWRFHTVPRPGEFGHETWDGDSWKERGGVNNWGGLTIDAKRGIVFVGTGSASFDFYGGDRKGPNLFANCTIALDARTGKRLWHFQTLHHDLWDHDLPCPPVLVTVEHAGRKVDAAAQVTKTGYVFLFDRLTGKPLFDVEERPVPASDVAGEAAAPTQPFPVKPPPFSRQMVSESDLTDISEEAHRFVVEKFRALRGGPAFTPPSLQGTVVIPGFHGGANWSGASFDPTTGLLYVNSNNVPNVTTLVKAPEGRSYAYTHTGYFRFLDPHGYPAIKPPWGNLTAIDLNTGAFAWQIVLGEVPELSARGLSPTGTENFGGTIVTAGGLVFIGGTKDEKFHAFDKATGAPLWEFKLGAGGYATPCTYAVNGRQFVAIAAGGGGKLGTKPGDAFVAFALPP